MNPTRFAHRRWWLLGLLLAAGGLLAYGHGKSVSLHGQGQAAATAGDSASYRTVTSFGFVDLEDGIRSLNPTVPGRVAEVLVKPGETVSAGVVLLRMEDTLARKQVAEAQQALSAAQAQLAEGRSLPEEHRLSLQQAEAAIKTVESQRNMAQQELKRKQDLARHDFSNARDLAIAQEQVTAAEAAVRAKEFELSRLKLKDPQSAVRLLEIAVARAELALEKAKTALAEYVVTSPCAGTVLELRVGVGDTIGGLAREAAVVFCPDAPRIIRAEVEQAFAALVAEGQEAHIEDDTHAAGVWTGRVKRVADLFTQQRPLMQGTLQFADVRTMSCVIELDPNQSKLRLGQRVRVTIKVPLR
jgi:HlyD family secretion protein